MDSSLDYNSLPGLTIKIGRSDGRIHPGIIKSVHLSKNTVMIEWAEGDGFRGKEIDFEALWALNRELLEEHARSASSSSSRAPSKPPADKNYTGRLRSSRIPAPPNFRKSTRQTCQYRPPPIVQSAPVPEYTATAPKSSVRKSTRQTCQFRAPPIVPPAPVPEYSAAYKASAVGIKPVQIRESLKENEDIKPPVAVAPAVTAVRRSVLPQELEKGSKRVLSVIKPPVDPQDRNKKGKFGDNRPHKQFYQMIEDFRETLVKVPLSPSDPGEAHRICVCVRKRPLNNKEIAKKEIDVVSIPGDGCLLVHEPKTKVDMTKYLENQAFHFDYAFDESSTNELVYRFSAKPLLKTIFEGGMATCFAYGQTGSGKTHTMGGDFKGKTQNSSKGIYGLTAQNMFSLLSHRRYSSMDLTPYVSFFEIYNEKVYDLLNKKAQLRVLEDEKQQVQVVGLEEMEVTSVEDVVRMIQLGSSCRTSGQTSANVNSSRSHAILQFILRTGRQNKLHGKFSLVDLAGNEKGTDVSGNDRVTMMETAGINRSLLALKECIRSLGRAGDHIPFRMSKLTQVLRDSFIGQNSRTCMIAMVSPGMTSCDYTLNTLRYADRVKELDGSSKPAEANNHEEDSFEEEETPMDSSSSAEEDNMFNTIVGTMVSDAITQVTQVEEDVHKKTSELSKMMGMRDIDVCASELESYATSLLEKVQALRSTISNEMVWMGPGL